MMQFIEIVFWASVFIILHTYIFYTLVLLVLAKVFPKKRKRNDQYQPFVSFIIAAYNEKKVIGTKIQNALLLNYPKGKIEFLFGSDHSDDGTDTIIKRFAKKHPHIRLFSFPVREGKASVINKLVPKAKGDVLVFSDANTLYHSESVRRMVAYFADATVGGVCGKLILIKPNDNAGGQGETLYWDYENRIKNLEGRIKTVFGATGGIYAIRKPLFHTLPMHRTNVSDDFLIPMRVVTRGYDMVYEPDAMAQEYASSNMGDEFRRKVRIGTANVFAAKEIFPLLGFRKGFIAFGLWSHKLFRWAVPILMGLIFIMNMFLWGSPFYRTLFILQAIFYLFAILGWLFDKVGFKNKVFSIFYYFVSVNVALCVGYYRYFAGTARPAWTKSDR